MKFKYSLIGILSISLFSIANFASAITTSSIFFANPTSFSPPYVIFPYYTGNGGDSKADFAAFSFVSTSSARLSNLYLNQVGMDNGTQSQKWKICVVPDNGGVPQYTSSTTPGSLCGIWTADNTTQAPADVLFSFDGLYTGGYFLNNPVYNHFPIVGSYPDIQIVANEKYWILISQDSPGATTSNGVRIGGWATANTQNTSSLLGYNTGTGYTCVSGGCFASMGIIGSDDVYTPPVESENATIKFNFPKNNTSTSIPDFNTYEFNLSKMSTSSIATYNIVVGATELTGNVANGNYLDYGNFITYGVATDTTIVLKALNHPLESVDNSTSTWRLSVSLQVGTAIISNDSVEISVNALAPIPNVSTTFQIGFHPLPLPSSTVAMACGLGIFGNNGSILNCISLGMDYILSAITGQIIGNQSVHIVKLFDGLKTVYPFAFYYRIENDIKLGIASTTLQDDSLDIPLASSGYKFVFYNSSSLPMLQIKTGFDWQGLEYHIIDFITLLICLLMVGLLIYIIHIT